MNFFALSGLINGIAALGFGFFGYFKDRKKFLHKIFGLMNLAIAIWAFSYWQWLSADSYPAALFWARTLSFGAVLIPIFHLHWILSLLGLNKKKQKILVFGYLVTFTFLLFSFSPLFVRSVEPTFSFPYWPKPGLLYHFYILFCYIGLLGYGIVQLFKAYKKSFGYKREQIRYVFLGLSIGALAGFTNFPLWYNIDLPPYGNPLVVVYVITYTYAMVRYRLMNIKLMVAGFFAFLISAVLFGQIFLAESVRGILIQIAIFLVVSILGYFLVGSVAKEIRNKERIQKLAKDLKRANEELKKLDKAKSEFISIASHQLRTPLTAIKGYISMMLEGSFGKLTEKERVSLGKVYASNERLIKLVEDLLNISRIESGRMEFHFKKVSLERIVAAVVDELKLKARKKKLYLRYKKPSSLPLVEVDPMKIRQVVANLIDNAIVYTRKGGVSVKTEEEDGEVVFSVADTGIGISPHLLKGLFQKFSRGKGMTLIHTEGTGLGLYVSRKIIEKHNGKIWAESKGEGRGSTFYFSLPIVR